MWNNFQYKMMFSSHIELWTYKEENSLRTQENWKMEMFYPIPRSSVEVDTFLADEVFLISMDFPLEEAFRNLDCNSFFSEQEQEN